MATATVYVSLPAQPPYYESTGAVTVPIFTAGATEVDTLTAVTPGVNSVAKVNSYGIANTVYYHGGGVN